MSDADIIIQTNNDGHPMLNFEGKLVLNSRSIIVSVNLYDGDDEVDALPEILNGEKLLVLSGIAHPERFEKSLESVAASVIPYRLQDHAEYDAALLEKISAKAKSEECDIIATTTKDAAKMLQPYRALQKNDLSLPPLAVVHSKIQFIGGDEILLNNIFTLFKP